MKVLITGAAGFVGSKIVEYLYQSDSSITLIGIDNLSRLGSESNLIHLKKYNCEFYKGDISIQNDLNLLPKVDWIIDCAANPSVLAGLSNDSLSLINNNLTGTFYLLEKCKRDNAGFVMLSTSRVYSIDALCSIPFEKMSNRLLIPQKASLPQGFSNLGVAENFSTSAPISLYGATKLSSEILALEYHYTFGFPVWINRCGVIAGGGQFGKIDQGIFSYWIYQYLLNKPLSFIGFGGTGIQSRDVIHPVDVFTIIRQQILYPDTLSPRLLNIGGGVDNTISLFELDEYCKNNIQSTTQVKSVFDNRSYDIPFYATDFSCAKKHWNWSPSISTDSILKEILDYGQSNIEHIKSITT